MHDQPHNSDGPIPHSAAPAAPAQAATPLRRTGGRTRAGELSGPAEDAGQETAETAHAAPVQSASAEAEFKAQLVLLIPNLRAFGISLAGRAEGDDLAQDALARAWKSRDAYEPGTNMKAWLFTILRNQFLSGKRRSWRNQPLDPQLAENMLVANDDPSACEDLADVHNAMQLLPEEQREALILAGPAGLSYLEVAEICGCAMGTVKSRVSRARNSLAAILEKQATGRRLRTDVSSSGAFDEIMKDAASIQSRLAAA